MEEAIDQKMQWLKNNDNPYWDKYSGKDVFVVAMQLIYASIIDLGNVASPEEAAELCQQTDTKGCCLASRKEGADSYCVEMYPEMEACGLHTVMEEGQFWTSDCYEAPAPTPEPLAGENWFEIWLKYLAEM